MRDHNLLNKIEQRGRNRISEGILETLLSNLFTSNRTIKKGHLSV